MWFRVEIFGVGMLLAATLAAAVSGAGARLAAAWVSRSAGVRSCRTWVRGGYGVGASGRRAHPCLDREAVR